MTQHTMPHLLLLLSLAMLPTLSPLLGLAQPKPEPHEFGVVHLNGSIYVSGEVIGFSALLTNAKGLLHPQPSTYGYFDIINPQGTRIAHWRSALRHARVSGQVQLPDTLSTGVYLFRFYTNWMRNLPQHLIPTTPFVVVSLANENPTTVPLPRNALAPLSLALPVDAQVALPEPVILGRESHLLLTMAGNPGTRYSVSVAIAEESNLFTPSDSSGLLSLLIDPSSQPIPPLAIPSAGHVRERGFSALNGRLLSSPTGNPMANQVVYLSYSDTVVNFRYAVTGPDGSFCFLLDSTHNNRTLVVQLADPQVPSNSVQWAFDYRHLPFTLSPNGTYHHTLSPAQAQHLEELRRRGLVSSIFRPLQAENYQSTSSHAHNFYYTPTSSVDPDEFYEMYDFVDLSENLLLGVRFRKRRDDYLLAMVSPEQQMVHRSGVLLLMDGHPFFNYSFLSALGSKEIERIDVFNGPFMFGALDFNGLVSVFTKEGVPLIGSLFGTPTYFFHNHLHGLSFEPLENGLSQPAIGPNVYWNPQMVIPAGEPTAIGLPPLAFGGQYRITVTGIADNGQIISSSQTFKVEQP